MSYMQFYLVLHLMSSTPVLANIVINLCFVESTRGDRVTLQVCVKLIRNL